MAQTTLPGFGHPLNYVPNKRSPDYLGKLFPSALCKDDIDKERLALPLTTLREIAMMQVMNVATDKLDWNKKVFDDEISSKWKEEAMSSGQDISEAMADWCIDEVKHKARIYEESGGLVSVYRGDVVKSDLAVPVGVKEALKTSVRPLEDVPANQKDWHPDSDDKVLDLVHPSLFPLVYGRTKILSSGRLTLENFLDHYPESEVVPIPPEDEAKLRSTLSSDQPGSKPYSRNFQWLPCEVDISGKAPKITSYINNLHPKKHSDLYRAVEQVIACSIPLWNMSLSPLRAKDIIAAFPPRIAYNTVRYLGKGKGKTVIQPEPKAFTPPKGLPQLDLLQRYRDSGLQVIVKLANIELTPEKPEYEGGTWHVEGQLNEHICATALYYYSSSNVTSSRLAFRQQCNDSTIEINYQMFDYSWLRQVFGCKNGGPGVQEVGSVATPEGRLLTFPNILQHQVQPFELLDRTKPGHRKILALFLVDPNIKIISTAQVPPQQKDWWREATLNLQPHVSPFLGLPLELQDAVFQEVDYPITLEEAQANRLKLMTERKKHVLDHRKSFKSIKISL